MKDIISKIKVLDHPIEKVWNAISDGEEISTWFIKADFKPEVGYAYTFSSRGEEGCVPITGIVKEANPYTLAYTWVVQDTDTETMVTWKLEDLNGKTKLYLEHSGISKYPSNTAVELFESFDGGWENCINDLAQYLIKEVHAE